MSSARQHATIQIWAMRTGGGHHSVAAALQAVVNQLGGDRITAAVDDPLDLPILPPVRTALSGYGPLVRNWPRAWGGLYPAISQPALQGGVHAGILTALRAAMTARTAARQPRLVVSCHPLLGYPAAAASAALPRPAPLVTAVTDLVGGHPGWLVPTPRAFLTATPPATRWCRSNSPPSTRVEETGLPIDPELSGQLDPEAVSLLRRKLGLPADRLCVLLAGGAEGTGSLRDLALQLWASQLPISLVILCGRNRHLLEWLNRQEPGLPTTALGYTESVVTWLKAADVYVGKAGPSSLAEAAAAGLAIVVTGSLPGQEEGNAAEVVAAGAAIEVRGPELVSRLGSICADRERLERMKSAARAWSRPGAALAAAAVLVELAQGPP